MTSPEAVIGAVFILVVFAAVVGFVHVFERHTPPKSSRIG